MQTILNRIYGAVQGRAAFRRISAVLAAFTPLPALRGHQLFDQADAVLITYGDSLVRDGEVPLRTLHRFCKDHIKGVFSSLHILPFFPYSSDDGFAVTDFMAVRSDLGTWSDIRNIGFDFKLMVDLVANHVSAQSDWFQNYLADEQGYEELAIEVDPATDLSGVTRPRALPLLTAFEKASGRRVHVWTTFSADQVDLNYRSLDVLEAVVRCLLFYVAQGARMIRLDAIAYLWKEIGTSCIHLPQTHDIVRLLRKILDQAAPEVILVTETNVPHAENVRYFGTGRDEAQMVYNFTLPPLLLHALSTGSVVEFNRWAGTLKPVSPYTTFLNFTASHDGIGVRPLEGIVPAQGIQRLVERVRRNGGQVSEKCNPDGSTSVYELNCTYLDALKDPTIDEDPWLVARFLASQAVAMVLPGVPGVYLHSLFGTRNWVEGMRQSGRARTLNRRPLNADQVSIQLRTPTCLTTQIFDAYLKMLRIRMRQPAFHPAAAMQVLDLDDRVMTLQRQCPQQIVYAVTNFSANAIQITLQPQNSGNSWPDLLSGQMVDLSSLVLSPYQSVWLTNYEG